MVTLEPDLDETTMIVISKRRHTVEIRDETESGLVIYVTPKEHAREDAETLMQFRENE